MTHLFDTSATLAHHLAESGILLRLICQRVANRNIKA